MKIVTLALNSILDKVAKLDNIITEHKLKCLLISFQAGLVYSISNNFPDEVMLKWVVAFGITAIMSEGTDCVHKETIKKVFIMLNNKK
ncbi:MAG: hypothetical protein ACK5QC_00845 [Bacteroidota bacterium]|jgi:fructose-1-phosphate kinase PfkB-like protein|nr:hypothetical protein [Bacteroidota bacterium]MCA6444346.1 hypothetical protein [Bacteroidota bacterium]